jgi:hypothetical protein
MPSIHELIAELYNQNCNGAGAAEWQRLVELDYRSASDPSTCLVEHPLVADHKPAWQVVLRRLAEELERAGVEYKVSGGTSAALHGVWLPVKDLDLEMGAEQAYRFQQIYQEYAIQPVRLSENDQYRSHFGKFEIDGVELDVMGDLERREGEIWKPTWTRTLDLIDLDGTPVRVSWLEEETLAYIRRGRLERAAQCLVKCDPERLRRLLCGEEPVGVI